MLILLPFPLYFCAFVEITKCYKILFRNLVACPCIFQLNAIINEKSLDVSESISFEKKNEFLLKSDNSFKKRSEIVRIEMKCHMA